MHTKGEPFYNAAHLNAQTQPSHDEKGLDTLADVLGDFLSKLSKLLRINADQQAESGDVGFQVTVCPGRECRQWNDYLLQLLLSI